MRLKRLSAGCLAAFLLWALMPWPAGRAYPGIDQSKTFLFSENATQITIPDTYKLYKTITVADFEGNVAPEPQDLFVARDGRIYVLDMSGGRVLIYSPDFRLQKIIDAFVLQDGSETKLNKPEGLFVTEDGVIYIADTKNQRILKLDGDGRVLFITEKPATFRGTSVETFYPTKVVADSSGRLSVVARNINMGLLQFDAAGNFTGYTGAPKVKVNVITRLWKQFSTKEQKAKMEQFVPTEYSNISIDKAGFIYGCISSIAQADAVREYHDRANPGDVTPIKKLNSMGNDVLNRNGKNSPLGNLDFTVANSVSRMIDVALGPAGSYTLLDNSKNLLYTYSDEGVLLHVFGGSGKSKESFERPVAIDYQGSNILVLDALLSQIMVFVPTEYCQTVLMAITAEYNGDFEAAYQKWGDIARMNANFGYAYVGLGKIRFEDGKYEEAMEYFQYAGNRKNYSKAKEKVRQAYMTQAFPVLFLLLAAVIAVLFVTGTVKKVRGYFRKGVKHGHETNS